MRIEGKTKTGKEGRDCKEISELCQQVICLFVCVYIYICVRLCVYIYMFTFICYFVEFVVFASSSFEFRNTLNKNLLAFVDVTINY